VAVVTLKVERGGGGNPSAAASGRNLKVERWWQATPLAASGGGNLRKVERVAVASFGRSQWWWHLKVWRCQPSEPAAAVTPPRRLAQPVVFPLPMDGGQPPAGGESP